MYNLSRYGYTFIPICWMWSWETSCGYILPISTEGRIRAIPVKYVLFMFTKKLECLCANLIQWQFTNWQIFLLRAWLLSKLNSFLLLSTMNYLCDIHITSISMPHSELVWLTKSAGPGLYNIYVSISIIISEISTWYL